MPETFTTRQLAVIASATKTLYWLFRIVTTAGTEYHWSTGTQTGGTGSVNVGAIESPGVYTGSEWEYAHTFKIVNFSGISLRRSKSESGIHAPNDVSFSIINASNTLTASTFKGATVRIALVAEDGLGKQIIGSWRFIVKSASPYNQQIDVTCEDFLQQYLNGSYPNTRLVSDIFPSTDGVKNDSLCVPEPYGTAYIPLRSVFITNARYYFLGSPSYTYTLTKIRSPRAMGAKIEWLASGYSFTQSTKTDSSGISWRVFQPLCVGPAANENALWDTGSEFLDVPTKFTRSDTATLTGPADIIRRVLINMGLKDSDLNGASFDTARTTYASWGLAWNFAFWFKEDRARVLSKLLTMCHSCLVIGEQVKLQVLSAASIKTITEAEVTKPQEDGPSSFKYTDSLAEKVSDSGYAAWQQTDESQDMFLKSLVPAETATDHPDSETIELPGVQNSIHIQKLTSLHLQRKLLKSADITAALKGTCLVLRPDDVITINYADFGGNYKALVDELSITTDCLVNIKAIRFDTNNALDALDDWGDLSFSTITIATDTSTNTYSPVISGPDATGGPNALSGRLRIGATTNYIVLDPEDPLRISLYVAGVETIRQGNLNAFLDYVTNLYGIAIGDATNYLKYDPSNGLRISGALSAGTIDIGGDDATSFHVDVAGNMWMGASAANKATAPFRVSSAGALVATSATISGILDIGGADTTSFHVDIDGNMWLGAATYNIATNPFAVSNAGVMRAVSGTIGGWTLGVNSITSTLAGIHSAGYAEGAEILLGHATVYNSAKVGFKADGSGKLASGSIYWDTAGAVTIAGGVSVGASLNVATSGNVRSGQTAYNTGVGFFFEYNGGTPRLSIGNPSGEGLTWDGTHLVIAGSVELIGDTIPWSAVSDDGGRPANNATVGATWGTNLSSIPTTLTTPSGDGLYLSSTYMGFYKSAEWKSFFKSDGTGGLAAGNITWDASGNLTIAGSFTSTATTTGGTVQTSAAGARSVLNASGLAIYDATTQRAKIGADGSGWLGASNIIAWTTAGAVTIAGFTTTSNGLSDGNMTWNSDTGYLKVGTLASTDINTTNIGFYADNAGNVLIKSGATANVGYVRFVSGAVAIHAGTFTLSTGTLVISSTPYITMGTTPPSSATVGTGIWMDGTGLYGLNANSQRFKLLQDGSGYLGAASTIAWTTAGVVTIGGFSVNSTSIYTGTEDHSGYTTNVGDITIYSNGTDASIHAKNFYIDTSGNLTAQSVTLSGAITATSGSIGGWDVVDGYIYNLRSGTPTSTPTDGLVLASGNEALIVYEDAAKRVEVGYLSSGVYGLKGYATNGSTVLFELSDTQTMIAGWTINSAALSNGKISLADATNAGIWLGTDGISLGGAGVTPTFSVTSAGSLYAISGTIGGWVVVSGYLYNLVSGTPTSTPSGGIVLASGNEALIVYENTEKRAEVGYLSSGVYGLKVYDDNGTTVLFEASDTQKKFAGWTFSSTALYAGTTTTRIQLDTTAGIHLGATAFADAPFNVSLAGVMKAASGTIGGCALATTSIGSTLFTSGALGVGWNISNTGTAEFQNVSVRGVIKTSVFEKDTISAVNGMVLITKADVLSAAMTALDASTLTIKGDTTFVANEVIRIKDGVDDEWMLVTNAVSAPTYTVTRDLASTYGANSNPVWKAGTAVVSMGVGTGTKTGYILLDSSSANSPFIDIYGRNSNTYTDTTLRARLGWLKGITDADVGLATTDVWGLYSDSVYLKGVIVANTGNIGGTSGWTITSGKFYGGSGSAFSGMIQGTGTTKSFFAGASDNSGTGSFFHVTAAGALVATSATITGAITASSGSIGSFTIGTYLYTGSKTAYNDANAGVHLGSDGIGIGNNIFTVSSAGALVATSATITGIITANTGYIGGVANGWTIAAGLLTANGTGILQTSASANTGIKIDSTSLRGYNGSVQTANLATDGSGWFGLTGTKAISWTTAGVVTIGGYTANATALYAGTTSTRIQLDTTSGMHLGATAFADAPFSVSLAGALVATSATITGDFKTSATVGPGTGKGIWLRPSTNELYFYGDCGTGTVEQLASIGMSAAGDYYVGTFGTTTSSTRNVMGVAGYSHKYYGVFGSSVHSNGIFGQSTDHYGVFGQGVAEAGVYGISNTKHGIYGHCINASYAGVYGVGTLSNNYGVYGYNGSGTGVYGEGSTKGVYGATANVAGYAVEGYNSYNGSYCIGVYGHGKGHGVYGLTTGGSGNYGVIGEANASSGNGVYGVATTGTGVHGKSTSGNAIYGEGPIYGTGDISALTFTDRP